MGYLFALLFGYATMGLAGTAVHIAFSITGIFFLGFPALATLAAYTVAIAERSECPPILAFCIAGAVTCTLVIICSPLIVKMEPEWLAVMSIGLMLALESVAKSWGVVTNGMLGISWIARPEFLSTIPTLAILAFGTLLFVWMGEYIWITSVYGRRARAYRESKETLATLGGDALQVTRTALLFAAILMSLSASYYVWRIRFIDPTMIGMPELIAWITIGILAFKPRLRLLIGAVTFVTLAPEALRFLPIASSSFGHIRTLLYCLVLLIAVKILAPELRYAKRSV